jgi:hypothetical protein
MDQFYCVKIMLSFVQLSSAASATKVYCGVVDEWMCFDSSSRH